jgi:hypothetical protein
VLVRGERNGVVSDRDLILLPAGQRRRVAPAVEQIRGPGLFHPLEIRAVPRRRRRHRADHLHHPDPEPGGADTVYGDNPEVPTEAGNDTIDVKDGLTNDTVDCGPGADTVLFDEGDFVTNCENPNPQQ